MHELLQRWRQQDAGCSRGCSPQGTGAAQHASYFCLAVCQARVIMEGAWRL